MELNSITPIPSERTYDYFMERETFFNNLIKGLERKEARHKFPNSVFWVKDGNAIFQLDENDCDFWCLHSSVWLPLEEVFFMDERAIQLFIREMVRKNYDVFKIKNVDFNGAGVFGICPKCFNNEDRLGVKQMHFMNGSEKVQWKELCKEDEFKDLF